MLFLVVFTVLCILQPQRMFTQLHSSMDFLTESESTNRFQDSIILDPNKWSSDRAKKRMVSNKRSSDSSSEGSNKRGSENGIVNKRSLESSDSGAAKIQAGRNDPKRNSLSAFRFVNVCDGDAQTEELTDLLEKCRNRHEARTNQSCTPTNIPTWISHPCNQSCDFTLCQFTYTNPAYDLQQQRMRWPRPGEEFCDVMKKQVALVAPDECTRKYANEGHPRQYADVYDDHETCLRGGWEQSFTIGEKRLALQRRKCELFPTVPFVTYGKNALVRGAAMQTSREIALGKGANFATSYVENIKKDQLQQAAECAQNEENCKFPVVPRVISLERGWGDMTYHFMTEVLPLIVPFIDDIQLRGWKVHIYADPTRSVFKITRRFLEFWGLKFEEDVVTGTVFGREVASIDMGGHAQYAFWGSNMLLHYRMQMLERARRLRPDAFQAVEDLSYVLVAVRSGSPENAARPGHDEDFLLPLIEDIEKRGHRVLQFRDDNRTLMECIPCQIALFHHASYVVGSNGAALAQILYAKPNATLGMFGDINAVFIELAMIAGARFVGLRRDGKALQLLGFE
jgi:hypothetical protein